MRGPARLGSRHGLVSRQRRSTVARGVARLGELRRRYGLPILVSVSRKSFLGDLTGRPIALRAAATLAAELYAVEAGVDYVRTHEPGALRDALAVGRALRG